MTLKVGKACCLGDCQEERCICLQKLGEFSIVLFKFTVKFYSTMAPSITSRIRPNSRRR